MDYTPIDLRQYPRRQHFEYFKSLQYPYVGVTNPVDVTDLVKYCKAERCSFYLLFLHIAALAADEVRELRQRIHDGGIVEYRECPTSHIELLDDGTYCYCTLRHHMPLQAYLSYAEEARKRSREKGSLEEEENPEKLYFISTLPWMQYTALIQPVAGGEESNPRITWGKFQKDFCGREQMPVTLLAHHGLVDGMHIAQFYENLDKKIQEIIG